MAVAISGCVFGGNDTKAKSSSGQIGDRDLAVPAQSIPVDASSSVPLASSSSDDGGESSSSASDSASSTSALHELRRIVAIADPPNDTGLQGPAYADAVDVTIDDDGVTARVRVRMRAAVPLTLANGEGVGVGGNINDAQVFADGEQDGWYAYLQTGDHLVPYPGTFEIAGDTLIFDVPWSFLGEPQQGTVDGFVDWSKLLIGQTLSSADREPDSGASSFGR